MKKLSLLLILLILTLTACSMNIEIIVPIYSEELSFNEEGHYYAQINGNGMKDFTPHQNEYGKCRYCKYYFETDDLVYKLKYEIKDGEPKFYYAVSEYLYKTRGAYTHIEVPVYHKQDAPVYQDEFDENYDPIIEEYSNVISATEYPVLEIESNVFNNTTLESIKLNEGLRTIGNAAFAYTAIKEIVIPNSVEGGIAEICVGCNWLETAIIGDGITLMDYYNFTYCYELTTVKLSKNTTEIRERNFYACGKIEYLIIPKSVVSIPEGQIFDPSVDRVVLLNDLFQKGNPPKNGIFFEITEEEYNNLYLDKLERDVETGLPIDPITGELPPHTIDPVTKRITLLEEYKYTSYGYVDGWCSSATLYFKGEWEYNQEGEPIPLIIK